MADPTKPLAFDAVDYVTTVLRSIIGPMQERLTWTISEKGVPQFALDCAGWIDGHETQQIDLRNMSDLVRAVRDVGTEWGPILFASRMRGLVVNKATYDKVKRDARAESLFRLADEWKP